MKFALVNDECREPEAKLVGQHQDSIRDELEAVLKSLSR